MYSQNAEEYIIRTFFNDRRGGFFLDVGCAWARQNSTTYFLERHLGWSGIGIDALSEYAEGWRRFRPNSHFVNVAAGESNRHSVDFYRHPVTGLSTGSVSRRNFLGSERFTLRKVPQKTLNGILDRFGAGKVDFLSMDIELGEMNALRGFDLSRFQVELVCIEFGKGSDLPALNDYFSCHGYQLIENFRKIDRVNGYFTPA